MATVYKRDKSKYWYTRFQWRGTEYRESTKQTTKAAAQRYLRQRIAELERFDADGGPRRTFKETHERFAREHLVSLKESSVERYASSIVVLHKFFEHHYLDEITRGAISDYVSVRKEKVSDTAIRRDLACLSSMMSCAVQWEWIKQNPLKGYSRRSLKESPPRTRYLSLDEFDALLNATPPDMTTLVVLAVETGMRMGEMLSLTWQQIDQQRQEIRLTETKTDEPRTIPLSPKASAHLSAHPRHITSPFVFHDSNGEPWKQRNVSHRFANTVKRAGLTDFRFHDLRHTFASWAVQGQHDWLKAPMDLYRLQKWLGHKWPHMTQRYAHLTSDDLHAVVDRVGTVSGTPARDLPGEAVEK